MGKITRRDFIKLTSAVAVGSLATSGSLRRASAKGDTNVVIIGGGFGGATCAKYLRRLNPDIKVTIVESNNRFVTCPFSNYVIADWRTIGTITQNYAAMEKYGVDVVYDTATAIDLVGKKVLLKSGKSLSYERLVVSPGIDFKWGAIEGYNEKAAEVMPHAWKAGSQTLLLRKKLLAMRNGDTYIMVAPPNPFRCPPGPYERASVIAHYLKSYKPRSKILILDAKEAFSKQTLFMEGWERLYPGMIEWVPGAKGGKVVSVNPKTLTVEGELDKYKGTVVNVIPAQMAGKIARDAGLADDSGWCPVRPKTFESTKEKGIYVIGDAAIAGAMPKSAFAANSQGKIAAAAIAAELRGESPADGIYVNTCYSLLAPDYGISVAGVYRVTAEGISEVPGSGGASPNEADAAFRADEAKYALGWYASIVADVFG
jgi:sulfide dehydrogenase [flavocytochrome c] flavoprotein subunit